MIKDLRKDGLNIVEECDIISQLEDVNIILGSTTKVIEVQGITRNGMEVSDDFTLRRVIEPSGYETFEEEGTVPTFNIGDIVAITYLIGTEKDCAVSGNEEMYEFLVVPNGSTEYKDEETDEEYEVRMEELKTLHVPTTKDVYLTMDKEITLDMLKNIEKKAHNLGLNAESLAIKTKRKIKIRLYGTNIKSKLFSLEESIFKVVIQ